MEEDLKILKVKYLSIHWSDFPQILNLSLGGQTKIKMIETKIFIIWPRMPRTDIFVDNIELLQHNSGVLLMYGWDIKRESFQVVAPHSQGPS